MIRGVSPGNFSLARWTMNSTSCSVICVSRDGGKSWTSLNGTGPTCQQVTSITVDPHDPDRLYLGTGGNSVFVGTVKQNQTTGKTLEP